MFRLTVQEFDFSAIAQNTNFQTGAMVLDCDKGDEFPTLIQDAQRYLALFAKPNVSKWGGFEALQYLEEAPLFVSAPFGTGALWAGIDVLANSVQGFGSRTGRNYRTFNNYNSIGIDTKTEHPTAGNGLQTVFAGTLPNQPVQPGSVKISLGGKVIATDNGSGGWSASPYVSAGSITYATGAYTITLVGVPGVVASYTSKIDLASNIDLSLIASPGYADIEFTLPITTAGLTGLAAGTYKLSIGIDGAAAADFDIVLAASSTWLDFVNALNTSLAGAAIASIVAGRLRILSATTGMPSAITIAEGSTAGALAAINLTGNLTILPTPVGGKNAGVKITIDQYTVDNIDLGYNAATTRANLITAINNAFTAATFPATAASTADSGLLQFIKLTGLVRNPTIGKVRISAPSSLPDATSVVFDNTAQPLVETVQAQNSMGGIPTDGQKLGIDFIYTVNMSSLVSHSLFARSPYDDAKYQLAATVEWVFDRVFSYTLYEKSAAGYSQIDQKTYSLDRVQNGFGKSIYIFDVFKDDPYVLPYVNSAFTGTYAAPTTLGAITDFTGGYRGAALTNSSYFNAWQQFLYANRFPVKTFMDVYGNSANTINTIIATAQPFAFGITCVPAGYNVDDAIAHRAATSLDTRKMAMYYNRTEIQDVFNDSFALTSSVGKIGVKYAQMNDVYDGVVPAGTDENGHGGQIGGVGYPIQSLERDLTDDDLRRLDAAQINPIVVYGNYGYTIRGNRTLQVALSDTSYIHTSRCYNYLLNGLITQVLQTQEFKFNDPAHRALCKFKADQFSDPIVTAGVLSGVLNVCNDKNNDAAVLQQRRFVLDTYVKATPDSEFISIRLIRVSQSQTLVQFL